MKYSKREHKQIAEAIEFAEKEEELIDSYENEVEDSIEDEADEIVPDNKKVKRIKLIINIVFTIILLLILMVATDIICVSRFNKGPFFAIPTHTYKDGGTKEYYGLGYKVIKYKQIQGRRDTELGKWSLKYNVEPITVQDVDMAIEFNDGTLKAYNKYTKKFVRIISTLKKVDKKNHSIVIGYQDEGEKYSLDIKCDIVKDQTDIDFEEGKEITIIGNVEEFTSKTDKKPNTLHVVNCMAEQ